MRSNYTEHSNEIVPSTALIIISALWGSLGSLLFKQGALVPTANKTSKPFSTLTSTQPHYTSQLKVTSIKHFRTVPSHFHNENHVLYFLIPHATHVQTMQQAKTNCNFKSFFFSLTVSAKECCKLQE